MSAAPEPLGKHVTPPLSKARLERQWSAIQSRTGARASAKRAWMPLGLALAGGLAALVIFVAMRRPVTTATTTMMIVDGTYLESPPAGPSPAVTLSEGSRVALGAKSRVRLTSTRADRVRLDLERGRVDVQATHVEGRSFVVVTGDVEVHVVGTKFSVDADGAVRVHVDEGRVRVTTVGGGERFVSGGEEWVEEPSAAPPPSAPAPEPSADEDRGDDEDAGAAAPRRPHASGSSAKELLDDAQHAMAKGQSREAAKLFDAIRREHRRDARAGLAAFELGRIRLDSLGDPAGAEDAFRDAMKLAREPGLRDDAEARRVEALGAMGSTAACKRARDAYLAERPNGVHRTEVSGRCGGS